MFRTPFLSVISIVVVTALSSAQNANRVPPRKASIVVPLLEKISPKDPPENVLRQIKDVLGRWDFQMGEGPSGHIWTSDLYLLDDGTGIDVSSVNGKLVAVNLCFRPQWQVLKELYRVPKTRAESN